MNWKWRWALLGCLLAIAATASAGDGSRSPGMPKNPGNEDRQQIIQPPALPALPGAPTIPQLPKSPPGPISPSLPEAPPGVSKSSGPPLIPPVPPVSRRPSSANAPPAEKPKRIKFKVTIPIVPKPGAAPKPLPKLDTKELRKPVYTPPHSNLPTIIPVSAQSQEPAPQKVRPIAPPPNKHIPDPLMTGPVPATFPPVPAPRAVSWVVRVELTAKETHLFARSGNTELHVVSRNLKMQSPQGEIEAEGDVKVKVAGLNVACEKLTISWRQDWVNMSGKVRVQSDRNGQRVVLTGDKLQLRLTTLTTGDVNRDMTGKRTNRIAPSTLHTSNSFDLRVPEGGYYRSVRAKN